MLVFFVTITILPPLHYLTSNLTAPLHEWRTENESHQCGLMIIM